MCHIFNTQLLYVCIILTSAQLIEFSKLNSKRIALVYWLVFSRYFLKRGAGQVRSPSKEVGSSDDVLLLLYVLDKTYQYSRPYLLI